MVLNEPNGTELNSYYTNNEGYNGNCEEEDKSKWWRFTPYDRQETIYWGIRLIALPLVASAFFIVVFYMGFYNNPILQHISVILIFVANIFLTSYARELVRARIYEITVEQGLIDVVAPYDVTREEELFKFNVNPTSPKVFTIGFVGDIMMLKKFKLEFAPEVIQFFSDVDLIVGNLEGIVREKGHTLTTQAHKPIILKQLKELLPENARGLLCLSNNHSIDFGNIEFHDSLYCIQREQNIYAFGRHDVPNVINVEDNFSINIATATQWSNQKNWDCISRYEDRDVNNGFVRLHDNNCINILFPHWSYENERYVRPSIRLHAQTLLIGPVQIPSTTPSSVSSVTWDLIFGHHSHVRQPIMKIPVSGPGLKKLVVFSGGNLTSGAKFFREQKHIYGIIMKCHIGLLTGSQTQYVIGDVEWRKTYNDRHITPKTKTVCIDRESYRRSNRNLLYIGIAIIVVLLILKVLELFNLI